jgi:glycosyltransferase involved in cell wall biosynthesis
VWLIPSDRFRYPLTFASVLVIHDLVHIHYPDAVPDDVRRELRQVVPARAAEATLCACMGRFIRDTDLFGVLRLPKEKVRMIRPAPPADFVEITPADADRLKPARLTRPYLFYPAAFRSYKNHAALIDALHMLRHRMGEDSFDLVFTGIHKLPKGLARQIINQGLKDRVHVLGHVDRRTLGALYRCAFATIVPSLYEQGSFPIYEALHWGCPVACSNIPSLVEQCQVLGDAMIYFDPHDPAAIARAILHIRDGRVDILARQHKASQLLWRRTWRDAAQDWLQVFREAIALSGAQSNQPIRWSA